MKEAMQIIRCQNCGAKNRVSLDSKLQPICGNCKMPLSISASPMTITDSNFAAEVEASPVPVLVDFWATWCPPCRIIAPIIDAVAGELTGKAKIGKLDVDNNPRIASRFNVQSIPTLIIFKDGKEADRLVGAQSKEAILIRLQQFL